MTRFVVDASVAVSWVIPELWSPQARLLLDAGRQRVAPAWLRAEVANVLWKRLKRRELTMQQAQRGVSLVSRYVELAAMDNLVARALDLAAALDEPVYDCLYVALAESLAAPLVTADRSLHRALRAGRQAEVIWIKDLPQVLR